MADIIAFPASARERAGKGAARATRRAGQVPGVVYGAKEPPVLIALDPKVLKQHLGQSGFFTRLVDIQLDGKNHRVLPRDVQYHPVTDQPIHVDFMRVSADAKVTVAVPVPITSPVGFDSVTVKVSSGSTAVSPTTWREIVAVVEPAANVAVPLAAT